MPIFLYSIEIIERTDKGLVLLPGIPQQNLANPGVGEISQGAQIELRTPDGSYVPTVVAEYFVRVPADGCVYSDISKLPIVLIVPNGPKPNQIQAGTEVWWIGD